MSSLIYRAEYTVLPPHLEKTPRYLLKRKGSTWVNGKKAKVQLLNTMYSPFMNASIPLHSTEEFIPAVMHGGFKGGWLVFMACCR